MCPNSALHRQQLRTVRRSLLIWSTPLREAALRLHSWSEIRKRLKWVELKNNWSDWSRRLKIWGGETLSWSSFHTQTITSISSRYRDLMNRTVVFKKGRACCTEIVFLSNVSVSWTGVSIVSLYRCRVSSLSLFLLDLQTHPASLSVLISVLMMLVNLCLV